MDSWVEVITWKVYWWRFDGCFEPRLNGISKKDADASKGAAERCSMHGGLRPKLAVLSHFWGNFSIAGSCDNKSFKTNTPSIIGTNEWITVSARDQNLLGGCTSCKIPKVSWNWGVTSIWCSWSWCGLVTLVSRCSNYTGFSLYKAVIPSQTWNCTKSPFRKWSQVSILFYIAKNLETLSSSEVLSTWVFFTGLDQYIVDQLKHITKEVRN